MKDRLAELAAVSATSAWAALQVVQKCILVFKFFTE